jgi:hypothetical protein
MPTQISFSKALEASHVIKESGGVLFNCAARVDATAPGGTYYVLLIDASKLPANGNVTLIARPAKVVHVAGVDDDIDLDFGIDQGVVYQKGCVVALSSTEFTLTIAGAYLSIDAQRS